MTNNNKYINDYRLKIYNLITIEISSLLLIIQFKVWEGYYKTAVMHPVAINKVEVPSILKSNFSPKINGHMKALNIIVMQDVDEIRITFPFLRAIPLNV